MSVLHCYTSVAANANPHPSDNVGRARQFVMSIDYHYTGEHVSCSSVSRSLIGLPMLTRHCFEFQYSQPNGESRPDCYSPRAFRLCLCFWFSYRAGVLGGFAVRVLSCHIPVSILKRIEALNQS
jgi:hypothetical protein